MVKIRSASAVEISGDSMRLTRRSLLRYSAMAGASLAMPAIVRGQESIFDLMNRGNVLRNVDKDGNTAAAEALIATNEPILSFDTAYNLQLAISQYEPFVAAGGWEEVPQEAFRLMIGKSGPAVIALKRR